MSAGAAAGDGATGEAKDAKDTKETKDTKDTKGEEDEEAEGGAEVEGGAEAVAPGGGAAIILIGSGEGAGFVWNLLCARPQDVVAAVVIDGVLRAEPTAGAFSTPCLFLQSPASAPGEVPSTAVSADMTRPDNVWRYYSTDGCRWCIASPSGDPLALAVAFARDVAAASPYVEAMETLESWQNNKLRHRIPMPVLNAKNYKEQAFRLATPDGRSVFPVASKTGAARNDLVWVPSAAFAARLAVR